MQISLLLAVVAAQTTTKAMASGSTNAANAVAMLLPGAPAGTLAKAATMPVIEAPSAMAPGLTTTPGQMTNMSPVKADAPKKASQVQAAQAPAQAQPANVNAIQDALTKLLSNFGGPAANANAAEVKQATPGTPIKAAAPIKTAMVKQVKAAPAATTIPAQMKFAQAIQTPAATALAQPMFKRAEFATTAVLSASTPTAAVKFVLQKFAAVTQSIAAPTSTVVPQGSIPLPNDMRYMNNVMKATNVTHAAEPSSSHAMFQMRNDASSAGSNFAFFLALGAIALL